MKQVQNKVAIVEENEYEDAVISNSGDEQEGGCHDETNDEAEVSWHPHELGDEDREILVLYHLMITEQKPTTKADDGCGSVSFGLLAPSTEGFALS